MSLAMIITSTLSITTGKFYYKGFPVYNWAEYIILAGGIAIPILAWLFRSPSRTEKKDK
jgi:hypothetical protein